MFSSLGFFKELLGRCNVILHHKEAIANREVQIIKRAINEHLVDLRAALSIPALTDSLTLKEWVERCQAGLTVLADGFICLSQGYDTSTGPGCERLWAIVQAACDGLVSLLAFLRGRYKDHFNCDALAPAYAREQFGDEMRATLSEIRKKLKHTSASDLFEILSSKSLHCLKCCTFTYRRLDYWKELLWKVASFSARPNRVSHDELYAMLVYFNFNCSWLYHHRTTQIKAQLVLLEAPEDQLRYLRRQLNDNQQMQVRNNTSLHHDQPVHRDTVRGFIEQEISFITTPVILSVPGIVAGDTAEEPMMRTNLPVAVFAVLIRLLFDSKTLYGATKKMTVSFFYKHVSFEADKRRSEENLQNEYYELEQRTENRLIDLLNFMIKIVHSIKLKKRTNRRQGS